MTHCWKDAADLEKYPNGATCMLEDGHEGPHEFTPDNEIIVQFEADGQSREPEDFEPPF